MSRETWKKNIVFSHFSRNLAQKAQKTLFSHDLRTLCIVPRKTWKSNVFSHILLNVVQDDQRTLIFAFSAKTVQSVSKDVEKHGFLTLFANVALKAQKRCFLHLCELCTKCLEKRENILLSHTFCGTSCKKLQKPCFLVFFAVFVQNVSKNVKKKHCFLTFFVGRRAKSSKNAVFRIFCELCTKCLEKREKHSFLTLFVRRLCKKLNKPCFSHFLWNLYKVLRKTWKNTVFSHFLWDVVQKAQKTLFFRFFCELCTKCLEKREKNTVF